MSESENYRTWESRSSQVKKFYASMSKGEKSKFLNDLNRNYELIPNTMSSKLSGYNKIKPVEIYVAEVELKKLGYNIRLN